MPRYWRAVVERAIPSVWELCSPEDAVRARLAGAVAALRALDLDAAVVAEAAELAPLQAARGWSDEQWDAAVAGLQARGLLDDEARATAAGTSLLDEVEATTDRLAAQPWRAVGEDGAARFQELAAPLARAALAAYPGAAAVGLAPRGSAPAGG